MNIAIYARVSTDKQEVENQIEKLKDYAKLREWNLVHVYTDTAISGRKASRPRLDKMKQHIKAGRVNGVLVWKLDRIGRSLKDLIQLVDYFKTHRCQFISYSNNIDTSSAEGKLMFHILGAFAEFEADLISERTKLSYDTKKKRAKQVGQKVKWGRKLKDLTAEEIALAQLRRDEEIGWRPIAKEINSLRERKNSSLPKKKHHPMVSYNKIRRVLQNG
jgi:DNA invertase Pin-like site-specific DNA recombinase